MKRSGPIRSKPSPNNPTAQQRAVVMERADYRCERCGYSAMHVHHRKFRSQGGGNEPANLVALCSACHDEVHSWREHGWVVSSCDDPALVPVPTRHHGLVLLTPDGGYEVTP